MSTFLDILGEAVARVQKDFPGTELYEADGTDVNNADPENPVVDAWRFVFNDPSTSPNSTVTITWQQGALGNPNHVDSPWLEDQVIPLPVAMDLPKAIDLMRKAGYGDPFVNVTLRFALYPGVTEPSYVFGGGKGTPWIFVGVNSGEVTTEPPT